MHRTQEEWIQLFTERQAWWFVIEILAVHTSYFIQADNSDGFVMAKLVTEDDTLRQQIADGLAELVSTHPWADHAKRIVGPATGATKLARSFTLTREFTGRLWASPEKQQVDGRDAMIFIDTEVLPGEEILLCEDVTTTGHSVELAAEAVTSKGGIILPYLLTIVNRSGLKYANGRTIISLIDKPMPTWDPGECPLCEAGSEAIRAKVSPENWARLNAVY